MSTTKPWKMRLDRALNWLHDECTNAPVHDHCEIVEVVEASALEAAEAEGYDRGLIGGDWPPT